MKTPKISVLMTIYNHDKYLKSSIKSILQQSFKNWELIAIDNGSTDNSKNILKSFQDRRIKKKFLKKNIGRTRCLNHGLDLCRGDYIAIQDSDDISFNNRLEKQYKLLSNSKELFLVSSNCQMIDEKNKIIEKKYMKYKIMNYRRLLFDNLIAHSTVMYKKNLIFKIGKYPKNFLYAQDYAFYLKVFKKFKIFISDESLLKARTPHINSETFRVSKTTLIINEQLKLLLWSLNNLNPTIKEKMIIFSKYLKLKLKKII